MGGTVVTVHYRAEKGFSYFNFEREAAAAAALDMAAAAVAVVCPETIHL
jgi:nucleoside phosphorylase